MLVPVLVVPVRRRGERSTEFSSRRRCGCLGKLLKQESLRKGQFRLVEHSVPVEIEALERHHLGRIRVEPGFGQLLSGKGHGGGRVVLDGGGNATAAGRCRRGSTRSGADRSRVLAL